MSGEGLISSIAEIRQRLEVRPDPAAPCCAVAKRDGETWTVLLMAGQQQLRLTPEAAIGLALDLVTAAELATDGFKP